MLGNTGGKLALAYGWRTAFFVVGAPGIVLAILMLLRYADSGGLDGARSWMARQSTRQPHSAPSPASSATGRLC